MLRIANLIGFAIILIGSAAYAGDKNCHAGEKLAFSKHYRNGTAMAISAGSDGTKIKLGTIFRVSKNRFITASHVVSDGIGVFAKPRPILKMAPFQSVVNIESVIRNEVISFNLKVLDGGNPTNRSKDWAILELDLKNNDSKLIEQLLSAMPILPLAKEKDIESMTSRDSLIGIGFPATCASENSMMLVASEGRLKSAFSISNARWWERILIVMNFDGKFVESDNGPSGPGASGGPVIIEINGNPQAVGLIVTGTAKGGAFGFVPLLGKMRAKIDYFMESDTL